MEIPVVLTKAAVLLSSSRLPYSLSLSSVGSGHMSCLIASCSRQCCSRCSAVMMSALHGHISDSPTLNLSYVSSSQPEKNKLFWSVQFVEAVWLVVVWVLLPPWWWSFHQYKRCICPLVPAGLPPWQAGLPVHFLGSRSVLESTAGLGLTGLRGRPGQFPTR